MSIILNDMREKIILDFTPAYGLNDQAHQVFHFSAVERCANVMNDRLGLKANSKLILLAAFFHDMFAWSRINHHLMSGEWVNSCDYSLIEELSAEERYLVAAGCREHRASNTDPFTCKFAELMNAADREMPGDVNAMVKRAVQYRVARGMSEQEALEPAIIHIKEKFGYQGYARYPQLYLDAFGDDLTRQREAIKNL